MKIVNKLHRFFHTPLTDKQTVVFVSIVGFYLCVCIVIIFTISEKLATYMCSSFFAFVFLLLVISKLCDYLYKKQKVREK